MTDLLKKIKIHDALFIAFVVSIICIFLSDQSSLTGYDVESFIDSSVVLFILSGIAYRFRNIITEYGNITKEERIHYATMILFSLVIFYFFSNKIFWGDDEYFKTRLDNCTLLQVIESNYINWSSRCFIETVLLGLVKSNIYLWRILTTILVTVTIECVISLFCSEKNKKYSYTVYLLAITPIPVVVLCDAGWLATTANYLWPLAAFMTLMVILKKIFSNIEIDNYEKAQAIVLTLFSANSEPLALCVFSFSLILFFYKRYEAKASIREFLQSTNKLFFVILGIAVIELLFILLSPGNATRTVNETATWYPEFAEYNIIDKIKLGIVSTMPFFYTNKIVYSTNFIMLLLMVFTCLKLWEDKNIKVIAFQSLGVLIVLFNQAYILLTGLGRQINTNWYILANYKIGPSSEISNGTVALEIIVYLLVISSLIVGIYHALGKEKRALLGCIVLLAGFGTRLILGFSPTVYASGSRTFLFAIASILIVTAMLIDSLIGENKSKKKTIVLFLVSILYVCTFSPKEELGIEISKDVATVDMDDLKKMPVHENNIIRNAFVIDVCNNLPHPANENTLNFDPDNGLTLIGWGVDPENRKPLGNIYVVIGNKCIKASYGSERTDVAKALQTDANVGFTINIPSDLFTQDGQRASEISVFLANPSNEFVYNPLTYAIKYPQIEEKALPANRESSLYIDVCNNQAYAGGDTTLTLSKETGLAIIGWGINFEKKEKLGGIQVIVGDTTINATYGLERKDVAEFFNMEDQNVGYSLNIPFEVFDKRKDVSKIEFVLYSKGFGYKYEPIIYTVKK